MVLIFYVNWTCWKTFKVKIYKPRITLINMVNFNIWDLERVNIKLKKEFLEEINKTLKEKFISKPKAYEVIFNNKETPLATFKNVLKYSYCRNFFVPLEIFLSICLKLNISRDMLQMNVISYKTARGINYIKNPVLPIKITPIFDMLLAHNIGDGTVINPGNGRLPYFGYRQFNYFYRIQYVKKIENIFGEIQFKENYFETSTRPYCPAVLSSLFFNYYKLRNEDFLSDRARIPKIVFDKGKDSLLAVLIAFIIDEGNVDSTQITINLKNKLLIEDLKEICSTLNYKSKITQAKSEIAKGYFRLHILREGMKEFWRDYLKLHTRYPIIDLGWKGEKINNSFKIDKREIIRTKGNKEIILAILQNEQLSVNQLADRLNMTRQGIRYHIHNLLNQRKIRIADKNQLNWLYGV